MGRTLLDAEPAFGRALDALDPIFREELQHSARELIAEGDIQGVERIQPMIFALQLGLADLWQAYGLRPAAVIGHSVGELAAAVTAGVLSVADAARIVCRRARLLSRVAGQGAMALVDRSFEEVSQRLGDRADVSAAIAAAPSSSVISGTPAAIDAITRAWSAEGLIIRRVDTDIAFHSAQMDALVDDFVAALTDVSSHERQLPFYSTVVDDPRTACPLDGAYWAASLRNPVRFAPAVAAAAQDGYGVFLEVSPHPVVSQSISDTLAGMSVADPVVAHSLRRHRSERETLLLNVGLLHCCGVPVAWRRLQPDAPLADLPLMSWQHRAYWVDAPMASAVMAEQHDPTTCTLLGRFTAIESAPLGGQGPIQVWQTHLDEISRPYPGHHPVLGIEIVPAAVVLNTFLAAAVALDRPPSLADVTLRVPIVVCVPRALQVVAHQGTLTLLSRPLDEAGSAHDSSWMTHATAVAGVATLTDDVVVPVDEIRGRCAHVLPPQTVVEHLTSVGVSGLGFPWEVEELRSGDGEWWVSIRVDGNGPPAATWATIFDAALSIGSMVEAGSRISRIPRMPAAVDTVVLRGRPPARLGMRLRVTRGADAVDIDLADERGARCARLMGARYAPLAPDVTMTGSLRRLMHRLVWRPSPDLLAGRGAEAPTSIVVLCEPDARRASLCERFTAAGVQTHVVESPEQLAAGHASLSSATAVIVVPAPLMAEEPIGQAAVRQAWLLARTAQILTRCDPGRLPRLWCLTDGVHECVSATALAQAPLWGLARILAGEHPELWGGLVDLPAASPLPAAFARVLRSPSTEDVIVLRDEGPLVGRLAPLDADMLLRSGSTCRLNATYLITGGLGGLGLEVARWLVGRGARRLVLAGRRGLPPRDAWDLVTEAPVRRAIDAIRDLEARGVTVRIVPLDIADRDQAMTLLTPRALGLPPIAGVVHAAGVLENRTIDRLDEDSLRAVMRAKVEGAWVLHELFPPGTLDFFVLFSSSGYLLRITGQASYAAGNAFLDALAVHRRAAGCARTLSLGWTSWRGLGMATSSAVIEAELRSRGVGDISSTDAFRAWTFAERHDGGAVVVLPTGSLPSDVAPLPVLSEIVGASPDAAAVSNGGRLSLPSERDALRAVLIDDVQRHVAAELNLAPSEVPVRRPLTEMGIDSVMTVLVRRALEARLNLSLPATLLWTYPTVAAVADYLCERVSNASSPTGTQ